LLTNPLRDLILQYKEMDTNLISLVALLSIAFVMMLWIIKRNIKQKKDFDKRI